MSGVLYSDARPWWRLYLDSRPPADRPTEHQLATYHLWLVDQGWRPPVHEPPVNNPAVTLPAPAPHIGHDYE
jgi:hypothetical protein